MHFQTFLLALGLGSLPVSHAINGKSYTGWDWSVNVHEKAKEQ